MNFNLDQEVEEINYIGDLKKKSIIAHETKHMFDNDNNENWGIPEFIDPIDKGVFEPRTEEERSIKTQASYKHTNQLNIASETSALNGENQVMYEITKSLNTSFQPRLQYHMNTLHDYTPPIFINGIKYSEAIYNKNGEHMIFYNLNSLKR